MPREMIYTEHQKDDTGALVAPRMVVSIGWGKGGQAINIGTIRNGTEHGEKPSGLPAGDGLYTTLSRRSEVNDLIRKLRKARDQSYGADA